jgi:acetyl-CoA acetyltransferase family protein
MSGQPVIVDAIRTPMGRGKPSSGSLASVHPVELLAGLLSRLVTRNQIDPGVIDDVIIGCVSQVSEQSATPGRLALLAAGFPEQVPATTIDRKCGSSQQAIHFAAQGVMAGVYEVVIAGGVESMSRVPMGSARIGADLFGPSVAARYSPGLVPQGVSAELVARKWGIGREEMDSYAAASHRRAAALRDGGSFAKEIDPVWVDKRLVAEDETIRPGTTKEALSELKPSFRTEPYAERFPEIDWSVTAGNSSQITDGAAVLLIASEPFVARAGLLPRARFVAFDVCGDDPMLMLTAPIASTRRVLAKSGLGLSDIDHFEINEAFASVPLAWQRSLGPDPEKLNPCGGAIALGHPLGASGARLMTTMLHALERKGQRFGLQSMCEAGGMANSTIIERIGNG